MSKGLETLKKLKGVLAYFGAHTEKAIESCNIIEQELKALEIIRENKVNVSLLFNTKNHWDYNDHVYRAKIYLQSNAKCLAQEEYDLLKEVLL